MPNRASSLSDLSLGGVAEGDVGLFLGVQNAYLVPDRKLVLFRRHQRPRMASAADFHSLRERLAELTSVNGNGSRFRRFADRLLPGECLCAGPNAVQAARW